MMARRACDITIPAELFIKEQQLAKFDLGRVWRGQGSQRSHTLLRQEDSERIIQFAPRYRGADQERRSYRSTTAQEHTKLTALAGHREISSFNQTRRWGHFTLLYPAALVSVTAKNWGSPHQPWGLAGPG